MARRLIGLYSLAGLNDEELESLADLVAEDLTEALGPDSSCECAKLHDDGIPSAATEPDGCRSQKHGPCDCASAGAPLGQVVVSSKATFDVSVR